MATSKYPGELGAPEDVQAQGDGCARNEDMRHRDVSNEMERARPEVGETIPDGATRQLPDTRESPCIV